MAMRVLQLISSGGNYGAEKMLATLIKALSRLGCESTLGVFHNLHRPTTDLADHARRQGIPVRLIPCNGRVDWETVREIRDGLRECGANVLHAHGYKADIYGGLAARKLGMPTMSTRHSWAGSDPRMRLYAVIDGLMLRRYGALVAVSDAVADRLRGWSGVPESRISTIYNGIDLSSLVAEPTLRLEIGPDKILVGMVGRLSPEKAPQNFLRAAQQLASTWPDVVFVLIGDGPMRGSLESLARELGIGNRVVFTGFRDDMPGVYVSLDVVVLPSLQEGMPMTILEAMGAGKPVVATSVGSLPRLVADGTTGLLVAPGNVDELAHALDVLLRNPELRQKMGHQARQVVQQRYTADGMARQYLRLYEQLLSAGNVPEAARVGEMSTP